MSVIIVFTEVVKLKAAVGREVRVAFIVFIESRFVNVCQNVSRSWAWDKKIGPISTKQAVRHLCFWTAPFFFCKEHSVLVFPMYWNHATLMLLVLAFFALLSYFKSGAAFWQRQWGFSSLAKSRFRSWNSFLVCTKICFIMFQMFLCRFGMVHQKEHQNFHQKWSCSDDSFLCFRLWLVPWLCRTSRWTFGCFSGHESSGFLKPRWWQDGPFKSFKFDTRQVCQSWLSSPKSWSSRRQWVGKCESLLLCLFESRFVNVCQNVSRSWAWDKKIGPISTKQAVRHLCFWTAPFFFCKEHSVLVFPMYWNHATLMLLVLAFFALLSYFKSGAVFWQRQWGFSSLAKSRFRSWNSFLVCTKICFIMFQMFLCRFGMVHQKEHQNFHQKWSCSDDSFFCFKLWLVPWLCRTSRWTFGCFSGHESSGFLKPRWWQDGPFKSFKFDTRQVCQSLLSSPKSWSSRRQWVGKCESLLLCLFESRFVNVCQNVSKSWAWDKKIGPISTKQAVRHLCFWTAPFFFCKEHSVLVFPMYWNHATLMLLVLAFFALLSYFKSGAAFWQRQWGFSSLAKSRFRSWNSFLVCTKICFIMFQMFLCRFGMVHQKEHQNFHQKWSCSDDSFFCFRLWLVPWLCRTSRWTFGCFSGHESSGFLKPRWWQDGPFKSFKFDTRQVCQSLLSSPKSWSSRRQWVGKCESLLLCLFESRFVNVCQNVSKSWAWDKKIGPISTKQAVRHLCFWTAPFFFCKEHSVLVFPMYWNHATLMLLVLAFFALLSYFKSGAVFWQRQWGFSSLAKSRFRSWNSFLVCTKICFIMFRCFCADSAWFIRRNTRNSIKNEVVQMTVFSVSNCDWFHGCVALRAEHLDVFRVMNVQVFWNPDGDKMVRLSHLSLTLVRYVSHYCLHRSREAQGGSGSGSASRFYCVYLSPDLERVWQNVSKSWAWDKKIGPISTKQAVRHLCFWTAPFFFCKEHSVLVFPMYWNHATLMLLVLAFFALLSYFKSGAAFWQRQWGFSSLAKSRFRSWNSFF